MSEKGWHDEAHTRRLPHDERAQFQCGPEETGFIADLVGQGNDFSCPDPLSPFGRVFWKQWSGYHTLNSVEATLSGHCCARQRMRCLKAFGERIMARDPGGQAAEIQIRIALMNRFSALGTAEIVRVD
jgi:hypothetical protein